MLTTVFLTADSKFAAQAELWIRQALEGKVHCESYVSLDAYKEMLEKAKDPAVQVAAKQAQASGKDTKQIKLFVVDLDLIAQKPSQWIADLQKLTKEGVPELVKDSVPKVLLMAFDGGVHRLEALQNDAISDLILKPVDKTLLLQKVEFLCAEDNKVNPTFLFRAKTAQVIEVGRDVVIDEISEFAVSVRSPAPVPEGAYASIHADVFGTKGSRRLIGRVFESVKHPVREGEYIARFSYFGVSPDQLSTIRRFIRANQTQVRTAKAWGAFGAGGAQVAQAGAGAAQDAGKVAPAGLSKELIEKMALLKMKKYAVIDLNTEALNEAKSVLETSFKGVTVRTFPAYSRLAADLRKLLPETAKPAAPVSAPAPAAAPSGDKDAIPLDQAFPNGKKLTIIIRGKSRDLVRFEPLLKKTDIVLGKGPADWLEKPDQFLAGIDREDKDAFDEFVTFIEAGTPGRLNFRMTDASGRLVYLDCAGRLEKSGGTDGSSLIRLDLQELDLEQWNKQMAAISGPAVNKDPSAFRFEVILIDGAFLRPDPATWYDRFIELLRSTKVLGPDDKPPKIFVMSDPKARARIDDFRIKGINDFSFKPIDRRYLAEKLKACVPSLVRAREPETPPFIPCEIPAKLGKEVIMDEVAEYGLSIHHPSAFKEGSFMKFFSRMFGEEGEWVTGKCHGCEKLSEGENFRCQFMFFGPAEDLLQRIRRWIKEDYVAKKEGKS